MDGSFDAYAPMGNLACYASAYWVCRHCDEGEPPCEDCPKEEE